MAWALAISNCRKCTWTLAQEWALSIHPSKMTTWVLTMWWELASYPDVQEGRGNAWYTLFAYALRLLLGNSIIDVSDIDVWAGFVDDMLTSY